jgi:hypothetical protein
MSPVSPAATTLGNEIANLVDEFRRRPNPAELEDRLTALAEAATPDAIVAAAEPFRDEPDVMAPLYQRVVRDQPENARALILLANAYWLQGRGPEVVGDLANRAIIADPANRAGWHLWALSESDPRQRVTRWQQVSKRFPEDHLAHVNVADNAAAVAGAERDYEMLDLAVATYEQLLAQAEVPAQRIALETALNALRGWKL